MINHRLIDRDGTPVTEIRISIDDRFLQNLRIRLRADTKAVDLVRDALTLYNWLAEERASGRVIISASQDGDDQKELEFPALDNAVPPALADLLAKQSHQQPEPADAAD